MKKGKKCKPARVLILLLKTLKYSCLYVSDLTDSIKSFIYK